MKLTNQLEEEIKQLMDDYWNSYFKGDLNTWASFLTSDYKNIGTTQEEIWNSREEILSYIREILPQMVGQANIRNKKTHVYAFDPYIMVHEFGDKNRVIWSCGGGVPQGVTTKNMQAFIDQVKQS